MSDYGVSQAKSDADQQAIRLRMMEDLASHLEQAIIGPFPEVTRVETYALAFLAKGIQTTSSIVQLARRGADQDTGVLTRVLAESLINFGWLVSDEATVGLRLDLSVLYDERGSANINQSLADDGPEDIRKIHAAIAGTHQANVDECTRIIEERHGLTKIPKKPTIESKAKELGLQSFYRLQYAACSSPVHSDGVSLSDFIVDTPGGYSFVPRQKGINHLLSTAHRSLVDLARLVIKHSPHIDSPGLSVYLDQHEKWFYELDTQRLGESPGERR